MEHGKYKNCRPFAQNVPVDPNTRFVVVLFEGDAEAWVIDSDNGIEEIKRYYRESFEHDVPVFPLFQSQNPMFVVNSEHFPNDDERTEVGTEMDTEIVSYSFGPFFTDRAAQNYLANLREQKDFVGGEAVPLLKPERV